MNRQVVSRRILLLLAMGMVSEAAFARGGGRGGRDGRGGRGGGAGGFGVLLFIGGVFGCFWLYGKIFGRKNNPSPPYSAPTPRTATPPLQVNRITPEKPPTAEWESWGCALHVGAP